MKRISKLLILVLVLAMSASFLSSCADTSYIATVNGTKVDSAMYGFLAHFYRISLAKDFPDKADFKEYMENVDTESNPNETRPQYVVLNETMQDMFEQTYLYKQKFIEYGLQNDPEALAKLDEAYTQFKNGRLGGDTVVSQVLSELKITEEKFKEIFFDYALADYATNIINYLYGEGGEKAIPNETFLSVFVNVKHILILGPSVAEGATMTEEQKKQDTEAKAKAQALYDDIKAGKKDFDTIMNDPATNADYQALEQYPDGYIISKASDPKAQSQGMVKEFEDAAFDMKIDELRLVPTKYGYHIMKKGDLSKILSKNRKILLSMLTEVNTGFETLYEVWMEENKLIYNNEALKKFDIRSVKVVKLPQSSS